MNQEDPIMEFAYRLERPLQDENIEWLVGHCAKDVIFLDPFNELSGPTGYRAMLNDVRERCREFQFTWCHTQTSNDVLMGRWKMTFIPTTSHKTWVIRGMSELTFNDGLLCRHEDHWDPGSQIFVHVPWIGRLWRFVYRRLKIHQG